jgi:hypothetical protein
MHQGRWLDIGSDVFAGEASLQFSIIQALQGGSSSPHELLAARQAEQRIDSVPYDLADTFEPTHRGCRDFREKATKVTLRRPPSPEQDTGCCRYSNAAAHKDLATVGGAAGDAPTRRWRRVVSAPPDKPETCGSQMLVASELPATDGLMRAILSL